MNRLTAISLYTGAGGLDLGFEAAGFDTRVAIEIDADAVRTLRANRAWPVIDQDVHSPAAASESILRAAGLGVGEADILIGGPPCQPFSKSGYWASGDSRRLADPRATTLEALLRVLRDTQPRAFLIENVPGLAFSEKSEGLDLLRRTISSINEQIGTDYSFSVHLVRAVEHGVPQDRQRVFMIGARDGRQFQFPSPLCRLPSRFEVDEAKQEVRDLPTSSPLLQMYRTAWDAIGHLAPTENDLAETIVTGKWADLLPSIPEGSNYLFHTDRGDGVPLFGWRRRYWSFLLKLSKRLPSWTLTAQPGPAIGPFHWHNRRLTRAEMLALQTFPAGYQVTGTYREAMKQIGNAVPSALAERLALEIRRQLFDERFVDSSNPSLTPAISSSTPDFEPISSVPAKYRSLIGEHDAHPGTGLGYGAMRRRA